MFDGIEKFENENLAKHTTLHINSIARWFLLPKNQEELEQVFYEASFCGVEVFVLGGGSNILANDSGFAGAVVSMRKFDEIIILGENKLQVGAGVNLFALNHFCQQRGFSGLEWSYGIPGSVGGAVKMNAGAYGGEFCPLVKEITIFDGRKIKKRRKLTFSYRKGCLKKGEILLSAIIQLESGEKEMILEKMLQNLNNRKASQPYGEFSLGSVFKRGKDFVPAKIIEEMGLKGKECGGMQVSVKHSGFIVNKGEGSADEFLSLVCEIEAEAKKRGFVFEREFVSLGFDE